MYRPAHGSIFCAPWTECGAGFTQKLVGMFQDMDISKDIMASFRQVREENSAA
jgi:hypothetical protein